MKKFLGIYVAMALLALMAIIVVAGSVYDRDTVTLTAGSGTWTNDEPYAALALKRIWIEGSTVEANTVTVTRVSADGTYTQAVGSVTFASGSAGNTATLTAAYCKFGDVISFDSAVNSNSTAMIEYEVQKH